MSEQWTKHEGRVRPVGDNTTVAVRYRNGKSSYAGPASGWRWENWTSKGHPELDPSEWDIVEWRAG